MVKRAITRLLPPVLLGVARRLLNLQQEWKFREALRPSGKLAGQESGTCYIIGSGPSLGKLDLRRLRGSKVIALNNLVVHPDYGELAPAYHLIAPIHPPQTEDEWSEWFRVLDQRIGPGTTFLCGLARGRPCALDLIRRHGLFGGRSVHYYLAGSRTDPDAPIARIDPAHVIDAAWAASVYAIAWALHLGFTEIILLGMDHNYFMFRREQDMRFYSSAPHQRDELARTFGDAFYVAEFGRIHHIFRDYQGLQRIAAARGAVIVNGGDDTVLKVFPCKLLDLARA